MWRALGLQAAACRWGRGRRQWVGFHDCGACAFGVEARPASAWIGSGLRVRGRGPGEERAAAPCLFLFLSSNTASLSRLGVGEGWRATGCSLVAGRAQGKAGGGRGANGRHVSKRGGVVVQTWQGKLVGLSVEESKRSSRRTAEGAGEQQEREKEEDDDEEEMRGIVAQPLSTRFKHPHTTGAAGAAGLGALWTAQRLPYGPLRQGQPAAPQGRERHCRGSELRQRADRQTSQWRVARGEKEGGLPKEVTSRPARDRIQSSSGGKEAGPLGIKGRQRGRRREREEKKETAAAKVKVGVRCRPLLYVFHRRPGRRFSFFQDALAAPRGQPAPCPGGPGAAGKRAPLLEAGARGAMRACNKGRRLSALFCFA